MSTLCCLWSDWHIGETISKEETESNSFSVAVAAKRIRKLVSDIESLIKRSRPSKIVILGLGDYISGNIHQELLEGAEQGVVEQTEQAGIFIAQAFSNISKYTKKPVTFYGLSTDNHGRLTKKPQYKGRYKSNLSYLCLQYARSQLSPAQREKFHIIKPISKVLTIDEGTGGTSTRALITHGDQVKSYSSLPYYGMERYRSRELFRRFHTDGGGFDLVLLGHFHVPALIGSNVVINGSLSGTSEFDAGRGYFSDPAQVNLLIQDRKIREFHISYLN